MLVVKGKFDKTANLLLWKRLSAKFSFTFYIFLVTATIVKNSQMLARISFSFLKDVLKQTRKSFNTQYRPQPKDGKEGVFFVFGLIGTHSM